MQSPGCDRREDLAADYLFTHGATHAETNGHKGTASCTTPSQCILENIFLFWGMHTSLILGDLNSIDISALKADGPELKIFEKHSISVCCPRLWRSEPPLLQPPGTFFAQNRHIWGGNIVFVYNH